MDEQSSNSKQEQPQQNIRRLVIILIALSIVGIGGRLWLDGSSILAGGDQLWRLNIDLSVNAESKATAVQIYPPFENPQLRIIQRNISHPGFRVRNWNDKHEQRRSILAFALGGGKRQIGAEFILHQTTLSSVQLPKKKVALNSEERERFLLDGDRFQIQSAIVTETLQKISISKTERQQIAEAIFDYMHQFAKSNARSTLHVPTMLAEKKATTLDRALGMVALNRAAGVPARLVTGLVVKDDIDPKPHYWVELYLDEKWLAYDPEYGYRYDLPANFLPMRRNSDEIVQVRNGELLQLEFDLEREFNHPYLSELVERTIFSIFDLAHLSLDARNELALLLLLPLGVLISALCRHLVGLRSYGVFTPTLLALALVYADKIMTMIIFLVVVTLAISGRHLFPAVITRIPRLAIIFTLIAIIMALSVSTLEYFELSQGGKIILLPVIILTSLVDRLYRTIEDKGFQIAMRRLVWTIFITLLCLPVIQFETLGHLIVRFPEIHLSTLALFLLISTYKGKQLMNLPWIRMLAEPNTSKKKAIVITNTKAEEGK